MVVAVGGLLLGLFKGFNEDGLDLMGVPSPPYQALEEKVSKKDKVTCVAVLFPIASDNAKNDSTYHAWRMC